MADQDLPQGAVEEPIEALPEGATEESIDTSALPKEPMQDIRTPSGAADLATGVGKGALQTVAGVGEAIHAIPGVGPALIPKEGLEAERKIATPEGTTQKAGSMMEGMGEWAAGEGILNSLGKIGVKSPALLKMIEEHPKAASLILKTLSGGFLGGAQAGVKAAPGEKGKEAAGGAVGGAVGSAAAEAGAQSFKPLAKALGLGGLNSEEAFIKAARPYIGDIRKSENYFNQQLGKALPRIYDAAQEKPFKTVGGFVDLIHDTADDMWKSEIQPQVDRNAKQMLSTHSVADNIINSISPEMRALEPKMAKDMEDFAVPFRNDMSLQKAQDFLQFSNKQLRKYYSLDSRGAADALTLDSNIAKYEAASDGLRDLIYNKLEQLGEPLPREMREEFGALKDMERIFGKRAIVADRQSPIDHAKFLSVLAGIGTGAGELISHGSTPESLMAGAAVTGAGLAAKSRGTTKSLIKQGLSAYGEEAGQTPVKTAIKSLGRRAVGVAAGETGERVGANSPDQIVVIKDPDGTIHVLPKDKLPEAQQRTPGLKVIG